MKKSWGNGCGTWMQKRDETMTRSASHGYALNKTGAVAPLVAVMFVLFIGCLALVVDLGYLHNVRVQLQRAADAAALAGALQLDGASNQNDRAIAAARTAAAANRVRNRTGFLSGSGGWVDDASVVPELGKWDTDVSAVNRFQKDVNPINALKVTASLEVQHIFAWIFSPSTTVKADAIAVVDRKEPGLPIALLSCIPSNKGMGETVCDLNLYIFKNDNNDTAGWTALTYNTTADRLVSFFSTEEGRRTVDKILYGTDESHDGLENTTVRRNCGGSNKELDIVCGLGPNFVSDAQTPVDPLFYDPLPRWDNTEFRRIWTMDEVLTKKKINNIEETDTAYKTRLKALRAAAVSNSYGSYETIYGPLPSYQKDGRHIEYISDAKPNNPTDISTVSANFEKPLHAAGYPTVNATNGVANSVIQAFINMIADNGIFKSALASVSKPLNETATVYNDPRSYGGGETLTVTVPIIFAGDCAGWKAGGGNVTMYYIGTANLLVTRVWQNQNSCNEARNPVEVFGGQTCSPGGFNPALDSDTFSCVTGGPILSSGGIEGLIVPKGKEEAGKVHVYLVE